MAKAPVNAVGVYKDQDVAGWWAAEKLDGVRGYWDGKKLRTRKGNVIKAPKWWLDTLPAETLDGELWIGRGRFDEVSGIVRSQDQRDDWKKVKFYIHDLPKMKAPYEKRVAKAKKLVATAKRGSVIRVMPRTRVRDGEHAKKMAKDIIAKGGEGIVVHEPSAAYVVASKAECLKIKGQDDAEAIVIRRLKGTGKNANRMGKLEVSDAKTGVVYRVGTGFSDAQRDAAERLYKKGTQITVRFTGRTPAGIPRHPRFVRVRDDEPRQDKKPPKKKVGKRAPARKPRRASVPPASVDLLELARRARQGNPSGPGVAARKARLLEW